MCSIGLSPTLLACQSLSTCVRWAKHYTASTAVSLRSTQRTNDHSTPVTSTQPRLSPNRCVDPSLALCSSCQIAPPSAQLSLPLAMVSARSSKAKIAAHAAAAAALAKGAALGQDQAANANGQPLERLDGSRAAFVAPSVAVSSSSSSPSTRSLGSQLLDLLLTIAAIYVCYVYYAILQEGLTTKPQPGSGKKFTQTLLMMLVQCAINCAIVWPVMQIKEWRLRKAAAAVAQGSKPQPPREFGSRDCLMPSYAYALLALSYLLGMISSYVALEYISYPTQVLVKSAKMLPVMLVGATLWGQRYSRIEYVAVTAISGGIWAFFALADLAPKASAAAAAQIHDSSSMWGIVLSLVSLLCDGLTGSGQDHFLARFKPSSELLMLRMNAWAVVELGVGCFLLTNQGVEGIAFLRAHPALVPQLVLFGIVSAFGQMAIFHCVTTFGALALSIITSTRKFLTILASVVIFGHKLNGMQWASVGVVFLGLGLDVAKKFFNKKHKHKAAADAKKAQ